MKKVFAIVLAAAMMLAMTACGASNEAPKTSDGASYTVAIVQQLDHISLDEIRLAIEAELDKLAQENGVTISYDEFNGQNDSSVLMQIGSQVGDKYDAIIPIATLAAQCMATATEESQVPVIYAAISDPAAAGLTDIANVTGTSDALNVGSIFDMMQAVGGIDKVGLLYSLSEPNSAAPIAQMKEILGQNGIDYIEKTGNTTDEVVTAAAALVNSKCNIVFTPTDNVVMAAEPAVAEIFDKAGILHYTGADSFVIEGAFATCGVNYTDLGTYTADMTFDILKGGAVPEYHVMDGGIITVNKGVAAACGVDTGVLAQFGELVEVE